MDYGFLTLILVACIAPQGISGAYHGKPIGPVTTLAHDFSGNVFAASDNSIVITNLNYDGNGPAAYFWGSFGPELDDKGEQLPDENGSMNVLKGYHNAQVLLKLPKKITEYKSIGIYCKKFSADFGHVKIPTDYELPKQQSLGKLYPKQQSTMAAEVILKDSATMMLRQFEYGGNCPGSAFFVAGPSANPPVEQLTHLMYDDGKTGKLERYDRKDVMVKLPPGHHWNEYRWFSVYCMDTKQSYADIGIDMAMAEKLPLYDPSSAGPPSSSGSLLGPFSALSTLSMSVAMLLAAIVLLR